MVGADDGLTALAPMLRVRPELTDYCRFGGTWRAEHQAEAPGCAAFHIVATGACSVERPGQEAVRLGPGDVLLLPHGDRHLVYEEDGRTQAAPITTTDRRAIRVKRTEGVAMRTELICGRLHMETMPDGLLFSALPYVIVSPTGGHAPYGMLVAAMRDELAGERAGAAAIARDLASALFVMLLRQHLEAEPPPGGLLKLLGARETARAAAAMLNEPARDWSLDALARLAATSRASLVRAFRRQCGLPPHAFLGEIRLHLARHRIRQTTDGLGRIAEAVGYGSEAALSRAMHRRFGIRPGAMRQPARQVLVPAPVTTGVLPAGPPRRSRPPPAALPHRP